MIGIYKITSPTKKVYIGQSAKEVSDIFKIKHSTLRGWLNGSAINKTSFIYV